MTKDEWIDIKDRKPPHMKEIRVWIENKYFASFERERNAVFLAFDGNIYDAEEQMCVDYVTKWKLAEKENVDS